MGAVLTAKFVVICHGSNRKLMQIINGPWLQKNLMEEKMSDY